MKLKIFTSSILVLFLASCATEKNLVVKQTDGNFLVIAYDKSRKSSEISASLSASNKCRGTPLVISIQTDYSGAIPEKENQITNKVLDMINQVTNTKGVNIPTSASQDLEAYKTQLIFTCE